MEIIGIIIVVFYLFFLLVSLIYLKLSFKFLSFKLEKHPILVETINSTLENICTTENIKVFNKKSAVMNEGVDKSNEAAGKYHYSTCQKKLKKLNAGLKNIEKIEAEYNMPIDDVVKLVGYEGNLKKEEFILPRISLAQDFLMDLGLKYYYETFFHELGHHFAIKELGVEHTEEDANRYAEILKNKHFPQYFKLFLFVYSRIDLTPIEEIKLFLQYFYFYYLKSKIK